jgi:outer membrane protein assembly factor BamB
MNKSRFFIALGVVICVVLPPVIALMPANTARAQPADSPWPMFGQNAQHTHRSPYSGPEVPKLKWSFTTGFWVYSSPAIGVDGTIYFGSDDNKLYAINPDGSQKWSFATTDRVRSSPAIGADGTIYVGSYDGKLYAINPDASQKWSFTTGSFIHSSPTIGADGTIYVGSYDKHLYAMNPDGSQKWTFTTADGVCSSPAIGADGTIYVGCPDGKLYAIDSGGSQKWIFTAGGAICSAAAIGADGTVYAGSMDGNLYAIIPDGSQKWTFATGDQINSSPAIGADGTVYVGSDDDNLYAVNPNGSQNWSFPTGDSVWSSPAIGADGTIYVGSLDGKLYAINPNGSQKWSFTAGAWAVHSSAAIGADGTIYIGPDYKLCAITEEFDLTISSTAGGSVTTPGEGTSTYDRGTVVSLAAQAEEGYRFVEWTGNVDTVADVDAASTTITMNGDYSIIASFEQIPPQFELTISSTAGGAVTAPGEGTFPYEEGTGVDLVAEAEEGYRFVNWTGDVDTIADVEDATTTITVNGDYSITANFGEVPSDEEPSDGVCFIATAAYGTRMAEEIEVLREFRDEYLLTNPVGQALTNLYYRVSPPMAEFINEHPDLKPVVRAGLLPAVAMSAVAVNTTQAQKMAMIGFLVLVSAALALWANRRRSRGRQYT